MLIEGAIITIIMLRRDSPIIRASAPIFLLVIAVGNLCVTVHVMILPAVDSRAACVAQTWNIALGSSLTLSAILAKVPHSL